MATTPVTITLRASDWENIAIDLGYLAEHCDSIGYTNSADEARRYRDIIYSALED